MVIKKPLTVLSLATRLPLMTKFIGNLIKKKPIDEQPTIDKIALLNSLSF